MSRRQPSSRYLQLGAPYSNGTKPFEQGALKLEECVQCIQRRAFLLFRHFYRFVISSFRYIQDGSMITSKHKGPISWLCLPPNSALMIAIPRLHASAEFLRQPSKRRMPRKVKYARAEAQIRSLPVKYACRKHRIPTILCFSKQSHKIGPRCIAAGCRKTTKDGVSLQVFSSALQQTLRAVVL